MKKGFTLVELVIVVAIFGVLFSVVSSTFFNALRAATKAQATQEVRQNGDSALSRIIHEVKGAERVVSCPTGSGSGDDEIHFIDAATGITIRFRSQNGAITRTVAGGTEENITDTRSVQVVPQTMFFTCDPVNPGARVDISFELEYIPFGNGVFDPDEVPSHERIRIPFQTSVVNRNVN